MDFALKSDIGQQRKLNEDYCGCYFKEDSDLSLFVLADGMGGHNAGEIASKITVESILAKVSEFLDSNNECLTSDKIQELSSDAICSANTNVVSLARRNVGMQGMGTTVVMASIWENKACISHVGDSRAYLISDKKISQLTTDHSYVEELIKSGKITREEAKTHSDRNMITRAIGVEDEVTTDLDIVDFKKSDAIILCSDGLTNLIDENEILNIYLKGSNSEKICEMLLKEANVRGGYDNITVIVIIKNI